MADEERFSLKEFGASFKSFLDQVTAQGTTEEPQFARRLHEHLGQSPATLPIVAEQFAASDHANVQRAIDAYLGSEGRTAEVVGIVGLHEYETVSIAHLIAAASPWGSAAPGPVQHVNVGLDGGRILACLQLGLLLIRDGNDRLALLVSGPHQVGFRRNVRLEAMAADRSRAERVLAEIRSSMRRLNVYRGHVISLSADRMGELEVRFHRLPEIPRDGVILPSGVLERIERHTVHFASHADALRAAGRHLKRGLLLHGPPGTGKTLTAMYLAGQMKDRTTLLVTGRGFGLIEESGAMARALQPSMVVLEDVDLVAEERTRESSTCTTVLFELLNQMDGLADDADVVFLLTSNRPEILEPALASRPGRIDQAVALPLPDDDGRRRLFELYGKGLSLRWTEPDRFIRRTEGASPALIRELLRKAALFAADGGDATVVGDAHLDAALHELVVEGGELTRSLLGYRPTSKPA